MNDKTAHDPQVALQERVKELTCLYDVVRIAAKGFDSTLDDVLKNIVELLPPAWQFPEAAEARIVYNSSEFRTGGYVGQGARQTAEITIDDQCCGTVEVVYEDERFTACNDPFLKEEKKLLDTLATEISGVIERHLARKEKARLEEQIRHADRLATIGQLAAGVAHELNEPLANILGFAQLALKIKDLPEPANCDIEKIVRASMHARSIVNKLRLFARQIPAKREDTLLNTIVEEGLYFTESLCAKQQIQLIKKLAPEIPSISADPGQMHQVLTNLTVNSVQAMPQGGVLIIETKLDSDWVVLRVSDTGVGISPEVKEKIFLPFFTTKAADQGTGLGLSVVEAIITTHRGTICVESKQGEGSVFEVRFPVSQEN